MKDHEAVWNTQETKMCRCVSRRKVSLCGVVAFIGALAGIWTICSIFLVNQVDIQRPGRYMDRDIYPDQISNQRPDPVVPLPVIIHRDTVNNNQLPIRDDRGPVNNNQLPTTDEKPFYRYHLQQQPTKILTKEEAQMQISAPELKTYKTHNIKDKLSEGIYTYNSSNSNTHNKVSIVHNQRIAVPIKPPFNSQLKERSKLTPQNKEITKLESKKITKLDSKKKTRLKSKNKNKILDTNKVEPEHIKTQNSNKGKSAIMKNQIHQNLSLDLSNMEAIMLSRRVRVRNVCAKYGVGYPVDDQFNKLNNPDLFIRSSETVKMPPTILYDIFFIDRKDELAWCPLYKAASTSWMYNFCLLGGINKDTLSKSKQQLSFLTRKVWPEIPYEEADQAFKFCLKFIIVRHPFERLVSAFRDKLENINIGREHGTEHFYKAYGRKIVDKYRKPNQEIHRYSQDMDNTDLPAPIGIEPTFEEFVKYLIDKDLVHYSDDHWRPYYLHCTPCLMDYDVIAKFETLEMDQKYLISKRHLEDKIKPIWKHLTKGTQTSLMIQKYFETITKKDLFLLYEKYKLDFELFNYSIDEYLSYVRK